MVERIRTAGRWSVLALVALAAACNLDPAPPFEVEGTGGVEGFLYFDADQDGSFSALAGDYEIDGADVVVFERGTQQAFSGGTATTDANGRFTVTGLPSGTHDLWIDTTSIPAGVAFCQNPVPVTVYLGEVPKYDVIGKSGCVISIAAAKEFDPASGEFVTVSGIVTSYPGQVQGAYTFIEDDTGGLEIYSSALEGLSPPIQIGDRIEVAGTLSQYGNALQIGGAVSLNDHELAVVTPVPMDVTTAEIAAAGPDPKDPLQGRLVKLSAAEITDVFGSAGHYRNAYLDDGSGSTIIRVADGLVATSDGSELNAAYPVGSCWDIVGFAYSYNGDGQIFPRSTDDIVSVPCN